MDKASVRGHVVGAQGGFDLLGKDFANNVDFRGGAKEDLCEFDGIRLEIGLARLDETDGRVEVCFDCQEILPVTQPGRSILGINPFLEEPYNHLTVGFHRLGRHCHYHRARTHHQIPEKHNSRSKLEPQHEY